MHQLVVFFPFYIDEQHFCLRVLDKRAHFAQCHFIPVIKTVTRSRRILLDSPVLSFRLHKKIKIEIKKKKKTEFWAGKNAFVSRKNNLCRGNYFSQFTWSCHLLRVKWFLLLLNMVRIQRRKEKWLYKKDDCEMN